MTDLASKQCVPCRGGVPALTEDEFAPLLNQLECWLVIENHHLRRDFGFPDFVQALEFVNKVGALAEEQGHHPDIHLTWGRVDIEIWTHKINGLTESDFVLAAKIDRIYTGS